MCFLVTRAIKYSHILTLLSFLMEKVLFFNEVNVLKMVAAMAIY